jgi:hypothetical protein
MSETAVHSPSREVLELIVISRGEKCLSTAHGELVLHFVRLRRAVRTLSLRFLALSIGEIQSPNGMR